ITMAGQGLVNRVVNNLVNKMVQPARTRRSDVHAGTPAHRLQSLQNGDVLHVVTTLSLLAPCSAVVVRQRSSGDVETPRQPRGLRRAGASKVGIQKNSTVTP